MDAIEGKEGCLRVDSERNWEPVEVMFLLMNLCDDCCGAVLNRLKLL